MQNAPQGAPPHTMVRIYGSRPAYRADAARLDGAGWTIASVVLRHRRPGLAGYLLLGAWAWWLRGRQEFVVTYVRPG